MILFTKIIKEFSQTRWELGFINNGLEGVFSKKPRYTWVHNPYCDRWFADPFILDVDDQNIYLLAEEMRYEPHIGRIAKLTINRQSMDIVDMQIVLEEPTHLSFPAIIRQDGHVYVYPENGKSGKLKLYELIDNKLVYTTDICSENLADAIITNQCGDIKMFSTKYPNYSGDTLYVYSMADKTLKIDVHKPIESIRFSDNHARMAGQFFEYNGKIYRPAQDCNKVYGGAIIIEECNHHDNQYHFAPIKRLTSAHLRYRQGMHTLNEYKGIVVVDVWGYKYLLGKIISMFVRIKKLHRLK